MTLAWFNALSESDTYLCIHKYPSNDNQIVSPDRSELLLRLIAQELCKPNAQSDGRASNRMSSSSMWAACKNYAKDGRWMHLSDLFATGCVQSRPVSAQWLFITIGFLDPAKKARTNRIKKSNAIDVFSRKNNFAALL